MNHNQHYQYNMVVKHMDFNPGQIAQLASASSQFTEPGCLTPGQGTYNYQPVSA